MSGSGWGPAMFTRCLTDFPEEVVAGWLAVVTNYGIMLPFSRSQGSEVQTGAGLVLIQQPRLEMYTSTSTSHLQPPPMASVYMYVAFVLQGVMK